MKIKNTPLKDLKIIQGISFYDSRGFFREVYKNNLLKKSKPLFWCLSKSKKNVLRGLHLQTKMSQEKYVSVIKGKILDVVIDLRKNSKTFGKYFKIILSEKNSKSILIPAGFAHGFLALNKENIVLYSNNNYRAKKYEIGIMWNDKTVNIKWPKKKFIISKKDKMNISFKKYKTLINA
ncbi:dTDP-4-dehydrorhamnose 3,5-epimerase [Pelagibacteraceae bacterium]|nr:dTDP-4-dehydrorhamnose 3,5-epimerase [Pelagibacteraceae bacterium]